MHIHFHFRKAAALLSFLLALICFSPEANAQRIALKTNALDYLTLSPNLALETRLSRTLSVQLSVGGNPINRPIADVKLTHFRVDPELRYWFNRPMARHFVALSATAGAYSLQLKERYIRGDVFAVGLSYGYSVVLSDHWNMEAEVGLGIGSFSGYNYSGADNKPDTKNLNRWLPVPIRLGLSFAYVFK